MVQINVRLRIKHSTRYETCIQLCSVTATNQTLGQFQKKSTFKTRCSTEKMYINVKVYGRKDESTNQTLRQSQNQHVIVV